MGPICAWIRGNTAQDVVDRNFVLDWLKCGVLVDLASLPTGVRMDP